MMKKHLWKLMLLLVFMPFRAQAQISSRTAWAVLGQSTTPTSCKYNAFADPVITYHGTLYACGPAGSYVVVGGGGSGITASGTPANYDFPYWTTPTNLTKITAPTTKGFWNVGYNLATDAAAAPTATLAGLTNRTVSGATSTDAILFTDNLNRVEYTGSVAVATSLATPTTLENSHFAVRLANHTTGTATAVTVTPTTWTINGAATLVIAQGQNCTISVGAGTDWSGDCSSPPLSVSLPLTLTRSAYGVALAAPTATITIASGAKALATGAIGSAACTAAQTDTATGTLTTDAIIASFNGDPTGVTGYVPLTTGMLTVIPYPTAGTVNFKVCNNTGASITPGAITLNWRVVR